MASILRRSTQWQVDVDGFVFGRYDFGTAERVAEEYRDGIYCSCCGIIRSPEHHERNCPTEAHAPDGE